MDQNRLKSKVVWLAILAQVVVVLQLTHAVSQGEIDIIKGVVVAVLETLTIFGVLNNPTSKTGF